MPRNTVVGLFYEFHRDRPNQEIGAQILRNHALFRVRARKDVYTPAGSDAISLAKDVHPGKAFWEGSHVPRPADWDFAIPENRRFPHYHPAGDHLSYGHVFYGDRGYRTDEARR
jgi:hypothetical protein